MAKEKIITTTCSYDGGCVNVLTRDSSLIVKEI